MAKHRHATNGSAEALPATTFDDPPSHGDDSRAPLPARPKNDDLRRDIRPTRRTSRLIRRRSMKGRRRGLMVSCCLCAVALFLFVRVRSSVPASGLRGVRAASAATMTEGADADASSADPPPMKNALDAIRAAANKIGRRASNAASHKGPVEADADAAAAANGAGDRQSDGSSTEADVYDDGDGKQERRQQEGREEQRRKRRLTDDVPSSLEASHRDGTSSATVHAKASALSYVDLLRGEDDVDLLEHDDPRVAARHVLQQIGSSVEDRMAKIFEKAKTAECRAKIGEHFGYFINAIGKETSLPFSDVVFENQCDEEPVDFENLPKGVTIGDVQFRVYQPPRDEAEYIEDAADLKLLYAIMTHDNPNATIRLIEALHEEGHIFVVHVDGKEQSDDTQRAIVEYAAFHDHVHVLPDDSRVRVNWGGFSMVNATMQLLRYAFAIDDPRRSPLDFHKFVHMASTSYPIASNAEIRRRIASYPLDANLMNVVMKPTNPHPHSWHYFVECDDAVHRIYRLPPMTMARGGGMELHTSSQWFILSREFAKYLAQPLDGTFVHQFLEYVEHVVVADESFFGTVLRNTPFCHKHHNSNFLHIQFDRWENELDDVERDERKCLMPKSDHCGRSPTTMTLDYLAVLELSGDLFARKFLDDVDMRVKDVLDMKRANEEEKLTRVAKNENDVPDKTKRPSHSFEGHGVLIVAKETVNDDTPLCLGLGESGNKVRLVPCFHDWVPQTLAPGWETGAVIVEETIMHNRWEVGPCSSDGNFTRKQTGEIEMSPGLYSPEGPRCMLKQMDGIRSGRCLDGESDRVQPGGQLQVFPCIKRWHQFISFGNGSVAPNRSIHTTLPHHVKRRIEGSGREQELYLCIGVGGKDVDEGAWEKVEEDDSDNAFDREGTDSEPTESSPEANNTTSATGEDSVGKESSLAKWVNEQVVTAGCSSTDAVIEWLFVPFIVEENLEGVEMFQSESSDEDGEEGGDEDDDDANDDHDILVNDDNEEEYEPKEDDEEL